MCKGSCALVQSKPHTTFQVDKGPLRQTHVCYINDIMSFLYECDSHKKNTIYLAYDAMSLP